MSQLPVEERIARDRAIMRLYQSGLRVDEIVKQISVSHRTAFRVLARGGPSQAALHGPQAHNSERDAEIVAFAQSTDDLGNHVPLSDIAEWYGIGRERVRQILREHGVGMLQTGAGRKLLPECKHPGCEDRVRRRGVLYCPAHRRQPKGSVTFPCAHCGRPKDVPVAYVESRARHWRNNPFSSGPQKLWFCCKVCQGKWLGALRRKRVSERKAAPA